VTNLFYLLADATLRYMDAAPGLLTLPYLALMGIPAMYLHELGHSLAARQRLGVRATIVLGLFHGSARFDGTWATRRDIAVIAVAGPAASLLTALIAGPLMAVAPPGVLHDALWAATGLGIAGVLNLIPVTVEKRRGGPLMKSDGRMLLDALLR
jgi:Zn-dependent protease